MEVENGLEKASNGTWPETWLYTQHPPNGGLGSCPQVFASEAQYSKVARAAHL
ncbi:O-antigen polymerase [Sesbania bispinosa]|nr:O-antigen polymerase [Sesbania bispinosa]